MTKQIFKDLPNTTTPLNSAKLNGLFDGDEALGNIVVDSIKSKNILDYHKSVNGVIAIDSTTEALTTNNNGIVSDWILCEPSTTYIISGGYNRYRWQTKASNGTITYAGSTTSITTNSTAKWLRVYYYYGDNAVSPQSISNVQVEKGSTATTFSPFQELNFGTFDFAKKKLYTMGGTANVTYNTDIPTNNPSGFAGLAIFLKGSEISLVPFGRRWWTNSNSYSTLLTTNSTLIGENTSTWTLTLTTTSTSGERVLILY